MTHAAHEGFRSRLACVGDVAALLVDVGALDGPASQWRRTFGRFSPWDDAWARLLLEAGAPQRIVTVDLLHRQEAGTHELGELGWARVGRFGADPRLPTLASALRRLGAVEVVRYRPGLRCTFRSALDSGSFGKVLADPRAGLRIHVEGAAIAAAAAGGEVAFQAARPLRYDPVTRAILQARVPGRPVIDALLGPDGADLAGRLGEAAGTVQRLRVLPGERLDRRAQLAKSRRGGAELALRVPACAGVVARVLRGVAAIHAAAPRREHVPIHGGMHPHQWLDDEGRLGLVDFDGLAVGEPELDVANFLAEIDFERSAVVATETLCDAFTRGFESVGGPVDGRLVAAYRAEKRLAKALRSARALRPDGDVAAVRHASRAASALAEVA